MKTVKFDLVLKVHNDLKESKLKDALGNYVINDEVAENLVQKVIGEIDPPENFFIHSMELKGKRKAKKNPVKSSEKNGVRSKSWDVV